MLKKIALVLLSVVLVVYLLRQIDVRQVFRVMAGIPPAYIAAGFVSFILGHMFRALRFKVLLGDKAPLGGLFSIIAVQTAAVGFLPLRSGEFSLMYLLKREYDVDYATGTAVLVLAKALDLLFVVTLFFISFRTLTVIPHFLRQLLPWAGMLFFLTAGSLILLGRAREIYARLPGFFREGPIAGHAIMRGARKVFKGAEVIRSKKTLVESLALTAVLWVFLYFASFFVYMGLGLKLTLLEMAFITTSFSLFANLPIHSPGGFGTMESFWVLLLTAMGVPKTDAIATGFASHLVSIGFALIFMLYGLRLILKKKDTASDG
ncbi:MAG: lysylphosphatidylglycerol synthase transmembrane domain-containing protein [Nitrospirota bacterium]